MRKFDLQYIGDKHYMSRRRKIVLGVLGSIVTVILVIITMIHHSLAKKEKQAIHVAQLYLEEKYIQEMKYERIRFSWIDPAIYHVYFSPIENSDLNFEVIVQLNLTLCEARIVNDIQYMADNYDIVCFEQQMANHFSYSTKEIWGNDASIFVRAPNTALYAFAVPVGLNDQLPLKDMEILIKEYLLHISTETLLKKNNVQDEAEKILNYIEAVKNSGYEPDRLVFRYIKPKTITDSRGLKIIGISNWKDIETVDQVAEYLLEKL